MTMNPLPPQAYTKEQLVKAYQWLQTQPDNIKELASNPDILVSLFLKAKMNGDSSLDRPSIQNFKNELKSLAGIMGEFDVMDQNQVASHSKPQNIAPSMPKTSEELPDLDYKTQSMIREVKNEMNLSSDSEAMRMLIAVGYKKIKSL